MAHDIWPLFDLRVSTPRLELRYVDDEMAVELARLAARGIHDPAYMPFGFPWTDAASPELERGTMQYQWRRRAEVSPDKWTLPMAAIAGGVVVGTTELMTEQFPLLREFETGSWLGREYQGRGIGKEMRTASLQLGFTLGAEWAATTAWDDNGPSSGVTRSLGYSQVGTARKVRRDAAATMNRFEMSRATWMSTIRRDDITIERLEDGLPLLGVDTPRLTKS